MTNLVSFVPYDKTMTLALIYDGDDSVEGNLEYSCSDNDEVISERFTNEATVFAVVQKFMDLTNRSDFNFYTDGYTKELQINRKYIELTQRITEKSDDIIISLQARLIFLKAFHENEHQDSIVFLESFIQHIKDLKTNVPPDEVDTVIDELIEKLVIDSDNSEEPSEEPTDSGYQTKSDGSPSFLTPDRTSSPRPEENEPPKNLDYERVASSLKNELFRSTD